MEYGKLIELLNEYCPGPYSYSDGHFWFTLGKRTLDAELIIISKKHGFIKWLVENEKIDFSWEGKLSSELVNLFERKLDNAEGVIALLSIQDEPIEFLISILK